MLTDGYRYVFIAVLFGASSGVCILPVLMRRYVGVENLAPAIGVAMVSMGVGDLLGPVLAGEDWGLAGQTIYGGTYL